MKISVIVPIYNTSKYLKKCINSIINQSIGFDNIELILINDGSSDNSETIINKYQKKYKNIKYLYQDNSGQGVARNKGLNIATGEYVSFVDSDDWIENNMLLDLYKKAIDGDFDIVTCNYNNIVDNNKISESLRFTNDINKNFVIMKAGPCNMIIKREFLIKSDFKFPEKIIYEDLASIPALAINAKIFHVDYAYYNYLFRNNSTMNIEIYNKKIEDVFIALDILFKRFKVSNTVDKYKDEIEFLYIRRLMMSASLRFISYNDPNNCIEHVRKEIHSKFPNWAKNKYYKVLPFRQKIVAILVYNNCKKCLKLLYRLNKNKKKIKSI